MTITNKKSDNGFIKVNEKYKIPLVKYCLNRDFTTHNFSCPFKEGVYCNYDNGCCKEE